MYVSSKWSFTLQWMNLAHGPRRTYRIIEYRTASCSKIYKEKIREKMKLFISLVVSILDEWMNYLISIALIYLTWLSRRQNVTPLIIRKTIHKYVYILLYIDNDRCANFISIRVNIKSLDTSIENMAWTKLILKSIKILVNMFCCLVHISERIKINSKIML